MVTDNGPRRRFAASGGLVFASLLAAAEAYVWLVVVPAEQRAAVARWRAGQASRAEVRRLALERWLSQGRHDVAVAAAFPTVRSAAAAAEAGRALDAAQLDHLREVLSVVVQGNELDGVAVVSRRSEVLTSAGEPPLCHGSACLGAVEAVAATRESRAELVGTNTVFVAPISAAHGQDGAVLGAVLAFEPVSAWLLPFLDQGRRGPEERVVLVQWQDGRAVAGLPRTLDAAPLAAGPVPGPFLSAPAGSMRDHEAWYRGPSGPLLAAVRQLNDGRWTISVQVDETAVLGPVRRQAWALSVQAGLAVALLGLAGLALTWGLERSHEAHLARQRAALATLFEQANDAILVMRPDGRITEANQRAEALYGRSRDELLHLSVFDLRLPEERPGAVDRWRETLERGAVLFEAEEVHRDGRRIPVEVSSRTVRWGEVDAVVAIVRDVGERRRAEAQILRLNRLLRTLHVARAAILRADERSALLQGVCEALTDGGLALLAWVGQVDGEAREVRPIAGAGPVRHYLDGLRVPLHPPGTGGQVARAVEQGAPAVCQDVVADPDSGPWRRVQIEGGFRAAAAFPLGSERGVEAVLAVYLREPNAFGSEEVRLFQSLAADLGEALLTLEREAERQRALEALSASEERYRILAENMADVIWTVDLASQRFTYVSPSVRKLRGRAPEELVGQPLEAALDPLEAPGFLAELRAAVAALEAGDESLRVQTREVNQAHADGTRVWVEVVTTLLTDAAGKAVTLLGVSRDVTARHLAEAALRERSAQLEAIFDSPALAVFALDRGLRYTGFNQVHARDTREVYGTEIALGQNVLEAITEPADRARTQACCERALAGEVVTDEAAWGEPQRGPRRLEVSYTPIAGSDGVVEGVAVFALDVTARRRDESRLRQLWQAVEQSPVVVVITDPLGRIEYVNPRFTETTGYSVDEVLGANSRLLKSGHTPPEVYRELWDTLAGGGVWKGEFLNRRKDGSLFWESASISPVRDVAGGITHYLAVKEDITERKRAAQALEETRQLLLHSQKMEAIGRLAGGVAHDFNNLLGVIRGNAELLRRQLPPDHPGLRRLDQVLRASDRGAELSRQLLAFGRKQERTMRVLDLGRAVAEAESMLRRLIGEDVELRVVIPASLPPIQADPVQIEQVLLNLAVNARDAMPEGGSLTIELARVDPETAASDGLPPTQHVALLVTDTGCGMDAGTLAHAFEPFFTTKDVGKGTGLGLATVYGIVSQLGGHVRVESQPGVGSTFRLYLPADLSGTEPTHPAAAAAVAGSGETVLLVEDEEGLRGLLQELLTLLGYRVLTAGRPEQALALSRQTERRIDLLLTDVVMPGGNGRDLARTLRAERPGLRVLLMSGYAADVPARPAGDQGELPLLDKPFTLESLSAAVRAALAS